MKNILTFKAFESGMVSDHSLDQLKKASGKTPKKKIETKEDYTKSSKTKSKSKSKSKKKSK